MGSGRQEAMQIRMVEVVRGMSQSESARLFGIFRVEGGRLVNSVFEGGPLVAESSLREWMGMAGRRRPIEDLRIEEQISAFDRAYARLLRA